VSPLAARVALLVLLTALATDAVAHQGGVAGYAVIGVAGPSVRYSLTLWPTALPPPLAAEIDRARAGDLDSRERLIRTIREKVAVSAQDQRCAPGAGAVEAPAGAAQSVTLVVDFGCAENVRDLRIRDDLVEAFGTDYHTLARIDTPARTVQFAFATEARETRLAVDSDASGRGVISFVLLGVEHILGGWDHLLFLVGLLLRGGGLLSLAKIITAFTLAHTVTLALAVLDVVVLPARLVEAVIALSIAFVAAENLFLNPAASRRWVVSFGFGLVHGFGFSSALKELGLPTQGLLLSLFGFNAGVELGQALVVAIAVPALMVIRHTRWERRVIWSSSAAILLVGVVLFVERAFL
jgi:hypothetical protein